MRLAVSVLTCFALSAMTAALADPATTEPSATAKAPAAAPSTAAPAATATPAAPAAAAHPAAPAASAAAVEVDAAQMDQQEKHFLSEGYKIEMHNGEKYFCRREEQMGSRLGGQKHCQTAQQLKWTEDDARRAAEHGQQNQGMGPKQ